MPNIPKGPRAWARALILGGLLGAPALAAIPAAEARPVPALAAAERAEAPLVAVQWGPPRHYNGPRHWRRPPPPPPHWRQHRAWHRGYPPPPPRGPYYRPYYRR
ncbi:hypothetical protein [Muricoccus pecuniae]|uniref:Uncharacterized protein n=1 Tax=Muricoccus pecuniae TaxID=693023 RepID=A0A840Y7Z3_9PROT|nr:hypothetical protein [Roseomonas pecuniae]MBB5692071.1 hypothetical protein [Roseomonas pecuniae]